MHILSVSIGIFRTLTFAYLIFSLLFKYDQFPYEKFVKLFIIFTTGYNYAKPNNIPCYVITFAYLCIDLYFTIQFKLKEIENMDEEQSKNFALSFMVMFTAVFDDYEMAIDSIVTVIRALKFLLMSIIVTVMNFVSLSLAIGNIYIESDTFKKQIGIEMNKKQNNNPKEDAAQKETLKPNPKEKEKKD